MLYYINYYTVYSTTNTLIKTSCFAPFDFKAQLPTHIFYARSMIKENLTFNVFAWICRMLRMHTGGSQSLFVKANYFLTN